jgi:hypothetical protein
MPIEHQWRANRHAILDVDCLAIEGDIWNFLLQNGTRYFDLDASFFAVGSQGSQRSHGNAGDRATDTRDFRFICPIWPIGTGYSGLFRLIP